MRWLAYGVIAATTLAFTVMCGLRWGLPASALPETMRFVFPLLPLALMLLVCWRWPGAVPSWLAFVCGLTMDLQTQASMGYWTLVYLIALLLAKLATGEFTGTFWGRAAATLGTMLAVIALQAAIDWSFLMESVAWSAILTSTVFITVLVIVFDLAVTMLAALELRSSEPVRMDRGGS